jgi:transcriptional regulator with XRE-family HTH domain
VKQVKGYGEKIHKYRKLKDYTQEELGDKVGVTKSFISKLESENTKPSLIMLAKLAKALDVEIGDLLNTMDPPKALKDLGSQWMHLGERLEKQGITPEQVELWAEIVKNYTQKDE